MFFKDGERVEYRAYKYSVIYRGILTRNKGDDSENFPLIISNIDGRKIFILKKNIKYIKKAYDSFISNE